MPKLIDRRLFLKNAAISGGAAVSFSQFTPWAIAAEAEESPHFFLQVVFAGGIDPNYTFDARPLDMTAKKLQVNYLGEEPKIWTGANGTSTLATSLVDPLKPHFDRFSVLNGVLMMTTFDGHQENTGYMISGNPFGGESFIPHLNEKKRPTALDALMIGRLFGPAMSNENNSVPLTPESASHFVKSLGGLSGLDSSSPLFHYFSRRFKDLAQGTGKLSRGSRLMERSLGTVPDLAQQFKSVRVDESKNSANHKNIQLVGEFFKNRLATSAMMSFGLNIDNVNVDCHDVESAKKHPKVLTSHMSDLAEIFSYLRSTAFDSQKSLLDVTTVLVSTEFGRTMRSYGDFEKSGTDHNPLRNTVIIGGKGIKPGLIVGSSDFQTSDETLSKAHLSLDSDKKHIMGRPFDFASMKSNNVSRDSYKSEDYLNYLSVLNTVYKSFGAKKERYFAIERNGAPAATLDGLLV